MLIALLAILGVNLIVSGELDGLRPKWGRGYRGSVAAAPTPVGAA